MNSLWFRRVLFIAALGFIFGGIWHLSPAWAFIFIGAYILFDLWAEDWKRE